MPSHPEPFTDVSPHLLAGVCGGQAATKSPAELRALAQQYCPQTAAANKSRPITRPIAERCLDEAGLGMFKGQLDAYFPRGR